MQCLWHGGLSILPFRTLSKVPQFEDQNFLLQWLRKEILWEEQTGKTVTQCLKKGESIIWSCLPLTVKRNLDQKWHWEPTRRRSMQTFFELFLMTTDAKYNILQQRLKTIHISCQQYIWFQYKIKPRVGTPKNICILGWGSEVGGGGGELWVK